MLSVEMIFLTRGRNVRDSLQRWPASKSGKVFGCYDKIDGIAVLKGVEIMLLWDGIGWNGSRRM